MGTTLHPTNVVAAWLGESNVVRLGLALASIMAGMAVTPTPATGQDRILEHARDVAITSRAFWTSLGYGATRAQYSIGWAAAPSAGYVLLGAPSLTLNLVTSGGAGVATKISTDALLKIAELVLVGPREAAQSVAASQRDEALQAYIKAYPLGRRLVAGEEITDAEALAFLDARWGLKRLAAAGALYAETLNKQTASQRLVKTETKYAVEQLINQYQLRGLGISQPLPIAKVAFFIKDLSKILQESGEGLWGYPPFLRYVEDLKVIGDQQMEELRSYALDQTPTKDGSTTRSSMTFTQSFEQFRNLWRTAIQGQHFDRFSDLLLQSFLHVNQYSTHSDIGTIYHSRPEILKAGA